MLNLVLVIFSLILNVRDKNMLALTLVVAAGIFIPIGYAGDEWEWFFRCICVELMVISLSLIINCQASGIVSFMSGMLILCHLISGFLFVFTDYKEYSYNVIVPTIETLQIVSLCIFSKTFTERAVKLWT